MEPARARQWVDAALWDMPELRLAFADQSWQTYWLTSGVSGFSFSPLSVPSYYRSCSLQTMSNTATGLGDPLYAPGLPYWSSAVAAIAELLFGTGGERWSSDVPRSFFLQIPYLDAFIEQVRYVDGQGIVVDVGGHTTGGVKGHELQAVWRHAGSPSSHRGITTLRESGITTFPTAADPDFLAVGLMNDQGILVDELDLKRIPYEPDVLPLPPMAVPEALDYLSAIWQVGYGTPLIPHVDLATGASLALPVANRSDVVDRLSSLSAILKAIRIKNELLLAKDATLRPDESFKRLRSVLGQLVEPERTGALDAVAVLERINQLRNGIQHPGSSKPLELLFAALSLPFPPDWPSTWDRIRHQLIGALATIRTSIPR
jgi:hypothetical protein